MPRGDGTGPEGYGPMSGRQLGYCAGHNSPGYTKGVPRGGAGYRRAYGKGYGFGRGPRGGYYPPRPTAPAYQNYPTYSKEDEKQMLEDELKVMKQEMKNLEKRLSELNQKKND